MAGEHHLQLHAEKSPPSPASMTAKLDRTLHALGFEYELISPERVTGRLKVTETCCQPFNVLSGGVSALLAESMASMGAYVASGFKRVAGVQLATNHLKAVMLGDVVEGEAKPLQLGRTIQIKFHLLNARKTLERLLKKMGRGVPNKVKVWEVQIWKKDPTTAGKKALTSTSRVTLVTNLQATEEFKGYQETVRKYAKL